MIWSAEYLWSASSSRRRRGTFVEPRAIEVSPLITARLISSSSGSASPAVASTSGLRSPAAKN